MNTLLLIQSITLLTFTFSLSIIPKQVMAVKNVSHYPDQIDTNFETSFVQSFSEKSIFSSIFAKGYNPNQGNDNDNEESGSGQGAGAH